MTDFEEKVIKLLEEIRSNHQQSVREYQQSQERYRKELDKPKVVAVVILGIIAFCLISDLLLRLIGK